MRITASIIFILSILSASYGQGTTSAKPTSATFLGGVGLYGIKTNYVNTDDNGDEFLHEVSETLPAINATIRIPLSSEYKGKGKAQFANHFILDLRSFVDMQTSVFYTKTNNWDLMYVQKHYLGLGHLWETRFTDNSFQFGLSAIANYTMGSMSYSGDEFNYVTFGIKTGQYFERYIFQNKKDKDVFSVRLGGEQFFTKEGGYVGQVAIFLGF